MSELAVLFCYKDGVYGCLDFIDLWDIDRDARKYNLDLPVIAHPPCHRWIALTCVNYKRWGGEHNRLGNDGGCFPSALASVERCGGVLEHPAKSFAWAWHGLDKPEKGKWKKSRNGWVCEVWQSAYGHKANKATWLYFVGENPKEMNWERPTGKYQVGCQDKRGKEKNKPTLSKKEANATPIDFRDALIDLVLGS